MLPEAAYGTLAAMSVDRRVAFQGAVNFRDIGGYAAGAGRRVRLRTVYRSDNLGALTDDDIVVFERLGIRTLIDLRLELERKRHANRLPHGNDIEIVEIGFLPEGTLGMLERVRRGTIELAEIESAVLDQYRRFVTDHTAQYRTMLDRLIGPERLPAVVHCTSGKDRTGFAMAILLMAVGSPRETIVEDYLVTNRFRRDVSHLFTAATSREAADLLTSARQIYLEAAFEQIDKTYGSVDQFLRVGLDLSDDRRARLIEALTEPTAAERPSDARLR
jgi:protein-tyrosine phosphatase